MNVLITLNMFVCVCVDVGGNWWNMELIPPFYSKVNTMIMQQQTDLLLQAHGVALPWPAACTTAYHHTYDGHPPTAVSIMDQ